MESATVTPPVEPPVTPTPTGIEPTLEGMEPPASIADHADQFGPKREPANTGQFANKPPDARHKAQSQRATPEDVAEINRLTRELRETEQRLADKDPDAKASPRIKTLKRQIAALKALEQPAATTPPTPKPAIAEPKAAIAEKTASEFSEKEPDINDFADKADPLREWMIAHGRWDRKREAFEAQQAEVSTQEKEAEQETLRQSSEKMQAFASTKPDFWKVTQEFSERVLPPVLLNAIVLEPEYVYHLAQHSELADELVLLTDGKPLSNASVAVVQRRLKAALGQAAQVPDRPPQTPTYIPPKPPNPVRTGPIKTADDPPGEASSISQHAKYYGPKR